MGPLKKIKLDLNLTGFYYTCIKIIFEKRSKVITKNLFESNNGDYPNKDVIY